MRKAFSSVNITPGPKVSWPIFSSLFSRFRWSWQALRINNVGCSISSSLSPCTWNLSQNRRFKAYNAISQRHKNLGLMTQPTSFTRRPHPHACEIAFARWPPKILASVDAEVNSEFNPTFLRASTVTRANRRRKHLNIPLIFTTYSTAHSNQRTLSTASVWMGRWRYRDGETNYGLRNHSHRREAVRSRLKMPRTYDEELKFIERINSHCWRIKKGFVPNMNVRVWENEKGRLFRTNF